MARIAGIDIPRDKQIWVALQRIHGIGNRNRRQPDGKKTNVGNDVSKIIHQAKRNGA